MAKTSSRSEAKPDGVGAPAAPYVVLARKYRPQTFDQLIGHGPMVQTLQNAFSSGRIAQAYMLTGVRGIGKTTTARILARALNYERDDRPADGQGATVDMPVLGRHCAEIIASRHPDVIEMDAASNTGVDDVREIIENARYKPVLARYKVFVVDEVHMLSRNAFNALLKTLEEPPAHAKFIFATTEIRKVPVTVLSRCQRFDLRRVDVAVMSDYFRTILSREGATAEDDALAQISRAAEGSVRDGLSILDQAIAMGSGAVKAADVRAMLGLADRGRVFDLLDTLLAGDAAAALAKLAELHRDGAEPLQILVDLADAVHIATRAKIAGADAAGDGLPAEQRRRAAALGGTLSIALLSRAWQMLTKGIEEAARSGSPLAAAEMVLIRIAYTADLPSPDDVIRTLGGAAPRTPGPRPPSAPPRGDGAQKAPLHSVAAAPVPAAPAARDDGDPGPAPPWDAGEAEPAFDGSGLIELDADDDMADAAADIGAGPRPAGELFQPRSFEDVADIAGRKRDARLKVHLEEHVSLVRFDPTGSIELHLLANAPKELGNELREKLNTWTGKRWTIALGAKSGAVPLGVAARERAAAELVQLKQHPAVAEVMRAFPEATIATVKPLKRRQKGE